MAPKQAKQKSGRQSTTVTYNKIIDPVVDDVTANPPVASGYGTGSTWIALAPLGVKGVTGTVASGSTTVTWSLSSVAPPRLPWLYNTARNFEEYRVTRAVLVCKNNSGSVAAGDVILDSDSDFADVGTGNITLGTSTGGTVKPYSTREVRHSMDVDSSWKKVSGITSYYSNAVGYPVSSVNDIIFSTAYYSLVGTTASQLAPTPCNLFVEYDVQFRHPCTYTANQ